MANTDSKTHTKDAARIACVEVTALPLQILLQQNPGWQRRPVAVVERDHPNGRILWLNRRARRQGVQRGQRYAAALALCPFLQAATVSRKTLAKAHADLEAILRRFTPRLERSSDTPGLFWLDARGLESLFPSLAHWGTALCRALDQQHWHARIAIGFRHFGVLAGVRGVQTQQVDNPTPRTRLHLFEHPQAEAAAIAALPLHALPLSPKALNRLSALGIQTTADLAALPEDGLHDRFGKALWRTVHADETQHLIAQPETVRWQRRHFLEPAEDNWMRLLFQIKQLLAPLLEGLQQRGLAVERLTLELYPEHHTQGNWHAELRPAVPTLDLLALLELVRLRLERRGPDDPVAELFLQLTPADADQGQLQLWRRHDQRDLQAANHALARVRAMLGENAVGRLHIQEAHLPEGRWEWQPLPTLKSAAPTPGQPHLMRRILPQPVEMAPPKRVRHRIPAQPQALRGPYILSGGWWRRPVYREYYFAALARGGYLWIYHDRRRRSWYVQGFLD